MAKICPKRPCRQGVHEGIGSESLRLAAEGVQRIFESVRLRRRRAIPESLREIAEQRVGGPMQNRQRWAEAFQNRRGQGTRGGAADHHQVVAHAIERADERLRIGRFGEMAPALPHGFLGCGLRLSSGRTGSADGASAGLSAPSGLRSARR